VNALLKSESDRVDVTRELGIPLTGTRRGRWFQRVPGNEQWQLEFTRKTLGIPALPAALDGLTIAHLSDWHFTGHVAVEYFEYLVKVVNERRPDLVVITGDIVDRVECLAWLPQTLGRLRATEGVWFLLGNHERRLARPEEVRRRLTELGLIDWGGRCRRVVVRGVELLVAGNELPWFGWRDAEPEIVEAEFRLLLAHSPDQWRWARQHQFQLILAGHTHGGQISLPGIGPVIAPSLDGVEYAGGVYEVAGRVMHVSRGISGKTPFRWHCPPEVTLLTLVREPAAEGHRHGA
jgi:predicted MPP superfamily phosphohydrolase